jgi:hypothetical protein
MLFRALTRALEGDLRGVFDAPVERVRFLVAIAQRYVNKMSLARGVGFVQQFQHVHLPLHHVIVHAYFALLWRS